jgi:hypothetical protein
MPAFNYHGTLNIIHSDYYYKTPSSNPYAPHVYWNVVTDDGDILPVISLGYKKHSMVEKNIKKHVSNVKEIVFLHEETEQEKDEYFRKFMSF